MGTQAAGLVLQPGVIMGLASCVFLEVQGKSVYLCGDSAILDKICSYEE